MLVGDTVLSISRMNSFRVTYQNSSLGIISTELNWKTTTTNNQNSCSFQEQQI